MYGSFSSRSLQFPFPLIRNSALSGGLETHARTHDKQQTQRFTHVGTNVLLSKNRSSAERFHRERRGSTHGSTETSNLSAERFDREVEPLRRSNLSAEDIENPDVKFCADLSVYLIYIFCVLFYLDMGTDVWVCVSSLKQDPVDWAMFWLTVVTSVMPNLFFCYQVWNYSHIMKSVDASVIRSMLEALTYTLPLCSVYNRHVHLKEPNEWRANLFGSARSMCSALPAHFYQFYVLCQPDTSPELRSSLLLSVLIVYATATATAFRYHLEIGQPTNLQKYRLKGFAADKSGKRWLGLLWLNAAVSSVLKYLGPPMVAVLHGFGVGVLIPVFHLCVNLWLHQANVARIRGMGWNPQTGKLNKTKWVNATLSAVMQRYLLDLIFIRAPNCLYLAQYEVYLMTLNASVCLALVFSKRQDGGFPVAYAGFDYFVLVFCVCFVVFLLSRFTVVTKLKEEISARTKTATMWLEGMDEKRRLALEGAQATKTKSGTDAVTGTAAK